MTRPGLAVVGCGMGRPELSPEAAQVVDAASVLCGGRRLLASFASHPGRRLFVTGPLEAVCEAIEAALAAGESVAVLADGDPLFYGIGRLLCERFGAGSIRFYPGVTALGAAAARLGRPWHDLPAVSLHGRDDLTPLFAALVRCSRAGVYTDARNTPSAIASQVLERGGDAFAMTVLEEMGLAGERVRRLGLGEAMGETFSPLNFVVIERVEPVAVPLALGLADDALLRRDAVFTKTAVRAVSLACLSPRPGDVVWDVGCGVGTVALEASLLCQGGPVFAVERDVARAELLRQNIRRTGALTVVPVCGEAPDVLGWLPEPDRIFVGGGLRDRPDLLAVLRDRLRPGGRLVINAVLLGSLHAALKAVSGPGFTASLTQLQASVASPLAGDLRLAADNPVFIVTVAKELA